MAKFAVFANDKDLVFPAGMFLSVPGRRGIDTDDDGTIDVKALQGKNRVWVWINDYVAGTPADGDVQNWTEVDDGLYQPLIRMLKDMTSQRTMVNPDYDDVKTDTDGDGVADGPCTINAIVTNFKFIFDTGIGDPGLAKKAKKSKQREGDPLSIGVNYGWL